MLPFELNQITQVGVDFLLSTFSAALDVPLGRDDVLTTTTGLRPLVDGGWADASDETWSAPPSSK